MTEIIFKQVFERIKETFPGVENVRVYANCQSNEFYLEADNGQKIHTKSALASGVITSKIKKVISAEISGIDIKLIKILYCSFNINCKITTIQTDVVFNYKDSEQKISLTLN